MYEIIIQNNPTKAKIVESLQLPHIFTKSVNEFVHHIHTNIIKSNFDGFHVYHIVIAGGTQKKREQVNSHFLSAESLIITFFYGAHAIMIKYIVNV